MDMFQAIVLGIIQGLTEFIPVSSTAHLIFLPKFFGWIDPGLSFDVILHLGTLTGVVFFFWKDFIHIFRGMFMVRRNALDILNNPEGMIGWYLIIGTIPAGIAGLIFKEKVETTLRTPAIIAVSLIFFGLVLWWADKRGRKIRRLYHMNIGDALFIGCAQAIALIPGVSRSGITISAGLFRGLERETAARFTFLLSTPIILAGGILSGQDLYMSGPPDGMVSPFIVGFLASAISGFMAIKYLLKYLSRRNVNLFVYYRIIVGILILLINP